MKTKIGKTLGMIVLVSGVAGIGSLGSGCETLPEGQLLTPQGQALGEFLVYQGVGSYISGKLDPKSTNVTVNNYSDNNQLQAGQGRIINNAPQKPLDCVIRIRPDNGQTEKIFGYYRGQEDLGENGRYVNMLVNGNEGVLIPVNQVVEIIDN